jgi:hypothetical protein
LILFVEKQDKKIAACGSSYSAGDSNTGCCAGLRGIEVIQCPVYRQFTEHDDHKSNCLKWRYAQYSGLSNPIAVFQRPANDKARTHGA